MTKFVYKFLFFILFLGFISPISRAQDYLADTLFIDFPDAKGFGEIPMKIDTIIDKRGKNPHLLKIEETNKFLVVPVDQYIWTKTPLNQAIDSMINDPETFKRPAYLFEINEFALGTRDGNLFSAYTLYTQLGLYRIHHNDTSYLGTLGYESEYPKKTFGAKTQTGYESVIETWKTQLSFSLWGLGEAPSREQLTGLYNFSPGPFSGKTEYLYGNGRFSLTNNGFLLDGEIMFSHRETKKKYKRAPYCLRYRNDKLFEAIELGQGADIFNFRMHKNWLAQARFNVFFGFNKWKNPENASHEFWDLFILDYSLSQGIHYDPMNQRNVIFGMGLTEGVYYNYFSGIRFDIGGYVSVGFKI